MELNGWKLKKLHHLQFSGTILKKFAYDTPLNLLNY